MLLVTQPLVATGPGNELNARDCGDDARRCFPLALERKPWNVLYFSACGRRYMRGICRRLIFLNLWYLNFILHCMPCSPAACCLTD